MCPYYGKGKINKDRLTKYVMELKVINCLLLYIRIMDILGKGY